MLLTHVHAFLARVVQKDMVELHPLHLVSECLAARYHRRRTKGEAPGFRMLAPAVCASQLVGEICFGQFFTHAQHHTDPVDSCGQKRLAHLVSGELFPLQQKNFVSFHGDKAGDG